MGESQGIATAAQSASLQMTWGTDLRRKFARSFGRGILFLITAVSAIAVLFILIYIVRGALPFFQLRGAKEFFMSTSWYPTADPAEFGALAIILGSVHVTIGAIVFAVPLGVMAAMCLSDVMPFSVRQTVKPIIEVLASIPSVAFGFFALVIFAPLLQDHGGALLAGAVWVAGAPTGVIGALLAAELLLLLVPDHRRALLRNPARILLAAFAVAFLYILAQHASTITIASGTNALNVSLILAVMVLPTVISVSEDALQAVGRELREASYACGATRTETLLRVVLPAASNGIAAAVILGLMRAIGETMVVWMASGNAAQVPEPWYNLLQPVRTLTATIAGDMGEADHVTGSARFHVLFAMALCLLLVSFACNLTSEWVVRRERKKLGLT